ncbi:MAG: WXG100 family type VII secretion target [Chloroflexota bacterium]
MEHEILKVDTVEVGALSNRFTQRAADIKALSAQIGATLTVVNAAHFRGHVGDALMAKYNEEFVPRFTTLEAKLNEINTDIETTITAYEEMDEAASDYFED